MKVYRLHRKKYPDELSGKGAAIRGARWNSRGVEVIYTSSSRALAMAEVLVHLNIDIVPNDFLMLTIEVPEDISMAEIKDDELPSQWSSFSRIFLTQKIGDQFIQENRCCLFKVPSVVVPGDFNFLINPGHPEFENVKVVKSMVFPFDSRFFEL